MQYGNGNYSYGKRVTLSYIFNGKLCDQMCIFLLLFGFFYDYIYFRYKSLHLSSGSFKSILTIHYGILLFPNMVSLKEEDIPVMCMSYKVSGCINHGIHLQCFRKIFFVWIGMLNV